jgi:hypothetical protein
MLFFSPQNPSGGSELSFGTGAGHPTTENDVHRNENGETPHGIPPDERPLPSEMQLADAEVSVGFVFRNVSTALKACRACQWCS